MDASHETRLTALPRVDAAMGAVGTVAFAIGAAAVTGWHLGRPVTLVAGAVPTVYNTGLSLMLCGAGLIGLRLERRRLTAVCGAFVLALCVVALLQYVLNVDLGVDQALMSQSTPWAGTRPGQMAPQTALSLGAIAAALLVLGAAPKARHAPCFAEVLGALVSTLGALSLAGYLGSIVFAYRWGSMMPIALPTAVGITCLGLGVLLAGWRAHDTPSMLEPRCLSVAVGLAIALLTTVEWQMLRSWQPVQLERALAGELAGSHDGRRTTLRQPHAALLAEYGTGLPSLVLLGGLFTALLAATLLRVARTSLKSARELQLTNDALGSEIRAHAEAERVLRQRDQQLQQAAKLESIGRLAGGIAHDFNNLLTVIQGTAGFLLEATPAESQLHKDAQEIEKAARRAAGLTAQLLAFARKQTLQPRVMDLNASVAGSERMLRSVLGEHVELVLQLEPWLGRVRADPAQLEQVLLNLASNARDAMPRGGRFILRSANVELDESDLQSQPGLAPGHYIELSAADTGSGMDETTAARVFEPFFTTKGVVKGTGLGLASVHGSVHQVGGCIRVETSPEAGSTFRIFLPRVEDAKEPLDEPPQPVPSLAPKTTRVLLVEDQAQVLETARRTLERAGFLVRTAPDAESALRLLEDPEVTAEVLVTDVIMPGLSGPALAARAVVLRPGLRVLFTSGHDHALIAQLGAEIAGPAFLQKPYSAAQLVQQVRELAAAVGAQGPESGGNC